MASRPFSKPNYEWQQTTKQKLRRWSYSWIRGSNRSRVKCWYGFLLFLGSHPVLSISREERRAKVMNALTTWWRRDNDRNVNSRQTCPKFSCSAKEISFVMRFAFYPRFFMACTVPWRTFTFCNSKTIPDLFFAIKAVVKVRKYNSTLAFSFVYLDINSLKWTFKQKE